MAHPWEVNWVALPTVEPVQEPARTVSEVLASFLVAERERVPDHVIHEAKRLVLNQLKASIAAVDAPVVQMLGAWAEAVPAPEDLGSARILWSGVRVPADRAAVVNGALFEVLDFNDTYVPTYLHATSGVLPALLALADIGGISGKAFLSAMALGMEAELRCARMLMPTGYYRGFLPGGLVGGVGAAAACAVLAGLDEATTRNALGLAMCTAFGVYEGVGSMTLPYIVGMTARSGFTAFELARSGVDAPRTAFEGDKGMLRSHSDERGDKVEAELLGLGSEWRVLAQTYKTMPTETITHAPLECALELHARSKGREPERMTFGVTPVVERIADERRERFGDPTSELEARFDLRFCAAAAWQRGRFGLAEMREAAFRDAGILDLRSRIDLVAIAEYPDFHSASLVTRYTDGSTDETSVESFLGSPTRPLSDGQLDALFRDYARPAIADREIEEILRAIWTLDQQDDVRGLIGLLRVGG